MILIEESPSIKCVGKTSLKLRFDFNQKIIDIIKQAGDAIWHKKECCWELPINKLSYVIDEMIYIDDIDIKIMKDQVADHAEMTLTHKYAPFDYQKDGVEWLINNPNGLLLDPPGLGKTLQTIYAAEELKATKGIEHCLIVCGINTLKQNWKKEILKFSTEKCVVIGEKINSKGNITYTSTKERAEQLKNKIDEFFVIINVESMRNKDVTNAIIKSENNFDMIVVDEVHKIGNPQAEQSKGLMQLAKVGKYHYGLTGTLLTSSPLNAYMPLKFINQLNSNWSTFKSFYCVYEQVFGHNQITGYKNLDILKSQIGDCSIRRSKDILNLPPKVIVPEYLEMSDQHANFYEALSKGIVEEADRVNIKTSSLLGLVVRLRQASTCPEILSSLNFDNCKMKRACDLVEEITSGNEKVVIFSSLKEPLYRLKEMLLQYNPLFCTGDQSDADVSKSIDLFQNDPNYRVMLATSQKMGTGITLNAANYGIFLDSDWVDAVETQVEDRLWRIGSTKTVIIYKLICNGTIDEKVQTILQRKRAISDYVIDDKETEREDLRLLLGLC